MADADAKSVNKVLAPRIKIVVGLPKLNRVQIGDLYLLLKNGDGDDKKIHIWTASGWLKSATLS